MRTKEEIASALEYDARIGTLWTNGKMIACIENRDSTGVELSNGYCPNWYELSSQWEPVASYLIVQETDCGDYLVGIQVGQSIWNDDISRAIQFIDDTNGDPTKFSEVALGLRKVYGPKIRVLQQFN